MTNSFQQALLRDTNRHVIWEIVKLYHPEMEETYVDKKGNTCYTANKLSVSTKYDWIMIQGLGVAIGVSTNTGFSGKGYTLASFQHALDNKQVKIKAWRFVDDSAFIKSDLIEGKFIPQPNCPDVHDLLLSKGIPLPTAKQMHSYYYED